MKKKIIFMVINMNVGGTEKALLNMINEIPKESYDITILMLEKYGGFLNSIPDHVHVEYLNNYKSMKEKLNSPPQQTSLNLFKSGQIIKAFNILFLHILSRILGDRSVFFRYLLKDYKQIKTEFDIAVAYAGPMDLISYFVINKIKAKRKIQWIHFDITKIGFNKIFASNIYKKFDKVFVVSNQGKEKLTTMLPNLKEKVDTFFNIISPKSIELMANQGIGFEDDFSGFRILTVGRLTKEKGQDLTIPVLAKLKKDGYNVRWYCLGDGNARIEYQELINKHQINADYVLLGSKTNPYPFIKECDLYVQPSRHEGYCITLAEAKYFRKPIISTNFTGASEQINDHQTGLIVNFDEEQLYFSIKKLLDDQSLKHQLQTNLQSQDYGSKTEINKLLKMAFDN
ncbi:glycosyltransferase [Neobacillus sp. M.A.Huq-85]